MKRGVLWIFLFVTVLFFVLPKSVSADIAPYPRDTFIVDLIKLLALFLITTLLLELPVFFVLGLRTKKAILTVFLANIVSVPLLFFLVIVFALFSNILILVLAELAVVILEGAIIAAILEEISLKKAVTSALIANAFSAIVGTAALNFASDLIFRFRLSL